MSHTPGIQRKLTTILAADAANFSGRMQADEDGTVQALRRSRSVFSKGIEMRGGRIANTAGDGLIAEFPSVIDAVSAAVAIQRELEAGQDLLPFRIGLHLGDVIVDGDDLLGDGVNLAARLQDMAREGGILATQQVVDHAKGRLPAEFLNLGPAKPKNFAEDISIFAVVADGVAAPIGIMDVIPRIPAMEEVAPALSPAALRYGRTQTVSRYAMVGFAGLDMLTGSGFGWAMFPIAAIFAANRFVWSRLDTSDQGAFVADCKARRNEKRRLKALAKQ